MKRFLLFLLAAGMSMPVWSLKDNIFFVQAALGSGTTIYGDKEIAERNAELTAAGYTRIYLAGDVSVGIMADEYIRFCVGAVTADDFFLHRDSYRFYLDYAFFTGILLYPGLSGLSFSVDYLVGQRADFAKNETVALSPWGNGFRFLVEYDFNPDRPGFAPVIGGSWRYMPRGADTSDHILSLYFRASIR